MCKDLTFLGRLFFKASLRPQVDAFLTPLCIAMPQAPVSIFPQVLAHSFFSLIYESELIFI